jgi:hypothetical protein
MLGLRSHTVNFKEVFTVRILQFKVNPFLNVGQFINNMRPVLATQFGINSDDIEIVEAGQYTDEYPPEGAPELIPSTRILAEIWGESLQNIVFYVRRKNYLYPQLESYRRNRNRINNQLFVISEQNTFTGDCPICLESSLLTKRYDCSHGVCSGCYTRCKSASITVCSLCRAS